MLLIRHLIRIEEEEKSSGHKEDGISIRMIAYLQHGPQNLPFTFIPGDSCYQGHTHKLMTMGASGSAASYHCTKMSL